MVLKKDDIVENITIKDITADGKSVARHNNQVIFITQGAPGDVVDIRISARRRRFIEGRIVKFHEKSPHRNEAFCEHFGLCGGCKWQHLSYEAQLSYKENHVMENLKKISGLELPENRPIIGSEETSFYRNKLEFTFSNSRWLTTEEINSGKELSRNGLGFHIPKRFDKVLDINKCWLQKDPSNAIRNYIKTYAEENDLSFFDLKAQNGLLRNVIIRITSTDELMVIVQFFEDQPKQIKELLTNLKEKFPQITSLLYIINGKKNETYYDLPVLQFSGNPYIIEKMGNLKFRIGPKSFYQTNSRQAHKLYELVTEMAAFQGSELVYDLYCGTGTIANFISRKVSKIIGIESVTEAVEDARINSEINDIHNTSFFAGDMKDLLSKKFVEQNGKPDVIITDPPRAGMHQDVVEQLNKMKPEKLIYVSCNPATQARDLSLLADHFKIETIQPVDMFPHTQHVENITKLTAK